MAHWISLKRCTYTAAIYWPKSKLRLGCISKIMVQNTFKKMHGFFFVLSFTRSNVLYSPTFLSNFHKLQSVYFQMVPRTCISLLHSLSYRQLDLGMPFQAKNEKKVPIHKMLRSLSRLGAPVPLAGRSRENSL